MNVEGIWRLLQEAAVTGGFAPSLVMAGWIEPAELPAHLAAADLAIYPLDDNLVNRCKCPAKLTEILLAGLQKLKDVLARRAKEFKTTIMVGRTHGIHAEPTTFGLKMGLMYDEFGRALAHHFLELFLGPFLFSDVRVGTEPADYLAVPVAHQCETRTVITIEAHLRKQRPGYGSGRQQRIHATCGVSADLKLPVNYRH